MSDFNTVWNEAKKKFLENWKTLRLEELEKTHGDKNSLTQLLQSKYGIPYTQAAAEVSEIISNFRSQSNRQPTPNLPNSEAPEEPNESNIPESLRKKETEESPMYPNKLYEEDLPPDIQLNKNDSRN